MSFGDMLENQLEEDSLRGVVVDRDKYNDQRIIKSMKTDCPKCQVLPGADCLALNDYQRKINGQWIHVEREMI